MVCSQLNSYSGADPIWGFVALIGAERFSGEAAVGIDPRVRLFAVDGRVYFAEREGDAPIGTRLVSAGVISNAQLEHGSVRIGSTSTLARLFQRDPAIDRDAVELTIETDTESLLASIAAKPVGMPEVFPLRHHSSGIHRWHRDGAPTQPADPEPVDGVPTIDEAPADLPTIDEATDAADIPVIAWPVVTAPIVTWPSAAWPLTTDQPLLEVEPPPIPAPPVLGQWSLDDAPEPAATNDATPAEPVDAAQRPVSYEPGTPPPGLPKLASVPISMADLVAANAESSASTAGEAHTLAADDIWEMVDVLTTDARADEQQLVGAGGPDKRGRGWLRGRKG